MRLEVGKIDKAHGVQGDVVVTLLTDRTERLDAGAVLFRSDGVEFTVVKARPHQHRFIVEFKQIRGREQADEARGTMLFADPIDDPDVLWMHDLIGAAVVDVDGNQLGMVESVEENPASDILVLEDDKLIPLTFLVEQQPDKTLIVDLPDGLFDPINAAADAED